MSRRIRHWTKNREAVVVGAAVVLISVAAWFTGSSPNLIATLSSMSHQGLDSAEGGIPAAGAFGFSKTSYAEVEQNGPVTITVLRSGGAAGRASVRFKASQGTAQQDDFSPISGLVHLSDGQQSFAFSVNLRDDQDYEGNETVLLELSSPTGGAVLGSSSAVLTIRENDPDPYPDF
jgi:hypothetical protein